MTLTEFLSNLANAFRTYLDTTDKINAQNFTDKVGEVFEKGKAQGGGGDDYYNAFWDVFLQNGNRYNFNYSFAGYGWTDVSYNPKYPFKGIKYANSMFLTSSITDTKQPLDFTTLSSQVGSVFQGCSKLRTIRTVTVSETITFINWFSNCPELENIEFAGTIGQNLDIHWSVLLTAKSYHSIMTHLSKTASITVTLPAESIVRNVYDTKFGSGAWDAITAQYPNVTISYM